MGAWGLGEKGEKGGKPAKIMTEVWINRGLSLDHDKEEEVVPMVDICLGYTTVLGAELFSERE